MKRSLFIIILATAFSSGLCLGLTACEKSQDSSSDAHLLYEQRGDHIAVTGLSADCTDENLVVPASHDGLPVAEIANSAFEGNGMIKHVTLPSSLEKIGNYAFADCSALGTAELGDGLETLGIGCFMGCEALKHVSLGNGLKTIGLEAFESCVSLEEIAFPSTLAEIDGFAFYNSGLKKAIIPDSVTHIGASAFYSSPLTELRLGGGLKSIGGFAFAKIAVEEIIFEPDIYTDVGMCAFSYNDALKNVKIGARCNSLPYGAFAMCTSLETVTLGSAQICDSAFGGCENLKAVYFLCGEEDWSSEMVGTESDDNPQNGYGNSYFFDADWYFYSEESDFDGSHWHYAADGTKEIWENAVTVNPHLIFEKRGEEYAVTGLEENNEEREIVIPGTYQGLPVTAIGEDAFSDHAEIERVVLPNGITEIGDFAFFRCEALTSVNLPKRLKRIGSQALSFSGIKSVTIPKNVVFGYYVFYACPKLTEVTFEDGFDTLGECAFYCCPALERVRLPEGLRTIPYGTFSTCPSLKEISLPDGLGRIEAYAFSETGLTEVVLPDSVLSLGSCAFASCGSLERVELNMGLMDIGIHAFAKTVIKRVVIPDSVITIGEYAFSYNDALESVVLGARVGRCEYGTFAMCHSLKSVVLYWNCLVTDSAFGGCEALETVYFRGNETFKGSDEEEWESHVETNVGMESKDVEANGYGNAYLLRAKVYYYSEARNADGSHWHFNDKKEPELWN